MNKKLEEIMNKAAEIVKDLPQKRGELVLDLQSAEAELERVQSALDKVDNLDDFDKATEGVKRAEMRVKFAKDAIDKLNNTPRMEEKDYFQAVDFCKNLMSEAAADYRKKAYAIMESLRELHEEYAQTVADVDNTLSTLDKAANILQSKFPCRVLTFQGAPDQKIKDGNAWMQYAVRFTPADAARLAMACENPENGKRYSSVLTAAWRVIDNAYPEKEY